MTEEQNARMSLIADAYESVQVDERPHSDLIVMTGGHFVDQDCEDFVPEHAYVVDADGIVIADTVVQAPRTMAGYGGEVHVGRWDNDA